MENENTKNELQKIQNILGEENPSLAKKFQNLCEIIQSCEGVIIAFSGGVDSSFLANISILLLDKPLCVIADSPTLPRSELDGAKQFAEKYHLNLRVIQHNELEDERFVKNDEKRCFYCKDGLFGILNEIKEKEGYNCVFDGSNFDDLDDYRPGRQAAEKNGVRSPLLEAELGKEDIRIISKIIGLSTWDKPQMACLSSRFPRNYPICEDDLKKIESAEEAIKELGYRDVRVRMHGDTAKIEIGKNEEIDLEKLRNVIPKLKKLGFKYVTLDLEGYRTGSLNE
jgi:uncharacterized protein